MLATVLIAFLTPFIAAAGVALPARAQNAPAVPCAQDSFDGTGYVVCTVEPGKADLRMFWRDDANEPYQSFSNVADAAGAKGRTLVFAINAGMYLPDFTPTGLYVEDGREMRPASTGKGPDTTGPAPNFYKTPNGIFYLDGDDAGILPTSVFVKRRPKATYATQSGPMLVIDGKINPIFIVGSTDRTRRSGVGVCTDGSIRFAISEERVNFHDFARLFRDHLTCPQALFLDGGEGTGIYDPALGRNDRSWHGGFGPIFGLVE